MTYIDRRAITNGKAPRRPEGVEVPRREPATWGEYWSPENEKRAATRGEMRDFGEHLGQVIEQRARAREKNRMPRRVWRYLAMWWAYLTTPTPRTPK